MNYAWTSARTERLRELWAEGWSASKIAAELGGITKNSVIGKKTRLGLPARRTREQLQRARRTADLNRKRQQANSVPPLPLRAQFAGPVLDKAPMSKASVVPPGARLVRFLDRRSGRCAWPYWEAGTPLEEMMCCGEPCPPEPDAQMCWQHHRIAHGVGTPSERSAIRDAQKVAA